MTTLLRKLQDQKAAITRRQRVIWLNDRDFSEFDVSASGCTDRTEKTSVHKPLLSAGDVTDKGSRRCGWMEMLVTSFSEMHRFWQRCACASREFVSNTRGDGAIDLPKERGVYNPYVQVAGGGGNVERAADVSPNEMEVEAERGDNRFSGGLRPVKP